MSLCSYPTQLIAIAGIVFAAIRAPDAAAGAGIVLDEQFESPTPTWKVRPAAGVQVIAQLRTRAPDANRPTTAERLVLVCPAGYAAHAAHDAGTLPVLDELTVDVTVRANRPGVQLAAQVVFPRSLDPTTGKPRTSLVYGYRYSQPGQWQPLRLEKLPLLAERQARLMSVDPTQQVDVREAYVDQVVLVVPGGPRESLLEVDRLTIVGVTTDSLTFPPASAGAAPATDEVEGPLLQAPGIDTTERDEKLEPVQVRRRGSTLAVAGVPLVPRVLEHRGESFEMIAELGFNAVWLAELPSEAQVRAARAARLWVICPPPPMKELSKLPADSIWQTVLAWSAGLDRDALALDTFASTVDELRQVDPLQRPVLVGAKDRPRRFGQLADILVRDEPLPLDGSEPVAEANALQVMGCSPWTQLSLGWSAQATRQAQLLVPKANHLGWHEPYRIRHAALEAMAAGARGLVIRTPERLSRTSPEARRLVDQLQLLNRELALVEPWLVAGKRLPSAELFGSEVTTTAWQLGQARLVYIPRQTLAQPRATTATTLSVAGVPETASAHLLSPAGLVLLRGDRVAGGYRAELGSIAAGGFVLLTDDARALATTQQRIGRAAAQTAQTERGLAVAEVSELESIRSQLLDIRDTAQAARVVALKRGVQQVDQLLASRDYPKVTQLARQIRHDASVEMLRLERESRGSGFTSVPTQYEPRLLPTHEALEQSLGGLPRGPNVLMGGDFEDLSSAKQGGWTHANYADAKLDTRVEFTPQQPYHGRSCLRLSARSTSTTAMIDDAEPRPVVWVTSPQVATAPGSVIEISGWARVATRNADRSGELLVVDSLGGEQLALRLPATTGWQPFRMIRTTDHSGYVQLNLALTGPASADVDAMMIREVIRPARTAATALQTK